MKLVYIKDDKNESVIDADCATDEKYYGVSNGMKGFIIRERWGAGGYEALCIKGLTGHNGWDGLKGITITDTIKALMRHNFKVYEFDTAKELMKWLSE